MKTPIDLRYSKDHEWVKVEGEIAIIGITDFAQNELGDIVYVDVEVEGEVMERDDVFGSIEAVKTISDLFLPVSGEVLAFNSELETKPEILNSDPYEKGWIIKVKMDNKEELKSLLDAEAYKRMVEI